MPARPTHARRCLELCERHGTGGFDLAFAHEALARAAAARIEGDDDREAVLADRATVHARGRSGV